MKGQELVLTEELYPDTSLDSPSEAANDSAWKALGALRDEVVSGLLYTHSRSNANTSRVLEAAAFLYALIELLKEKGIITIEELDARKPTVAQRVEKRFLSKGMGVMIQEPEQDKYAFPGEVRVDCENRLHLCKAACCRLSFPLSKQDITEGIVKWDLGSPYLIAQDAEGYCQHLDRTTHGCTVREHRPIPCRAYNCRNDQRIWLDFDNKVINPNLDTLFQKDQSEAVRESRLC